MMNRLASNSLGPNVTLIDAAMDTKAMTTTGAVASAPRQPHRTAPQNSEKMKYVKNGLDGPSDRYWNTEKATMSTTCVVIGSQPVLGRRHMRAARATEYEMYAMCRT